MLDTLTAVPEETGVTIRPPMSMTVEEEDLARAAEEELTLFGVLLDGDVRVAKKAMDGRRTRRHSDGGEDIWELVEAIRKTVAPVSDDLLRLQREYCFLLLSALLTSDVFAGGDIPFRNDQWCGQDSTCVGTQCTCDSGSQYRW